MTNDNDTGAISRRGMMQAFGALSAGTLAARSAALRAQIVPVSPVPPGSPVDLARWSPELHAKAESFFVLDGVAHCYNHSAINERDKSAAKTLDVSSAYHEWSTPARFRLTPQQYARDWQADETMDVMFLESATDMIVMHSVPLYYHFWDGLVSNEKGAYLKGRYPDRVIWYGALDVFENFDRIKAKIDQLAEQGADGIKLYPTQLDHLTKKTDNWFLDDEKKAFPLIEYVESKGIRNIAVHKLVGFTADSPALGINDFYKAAAQFPHMNFHIVHGGWMMLDETAELMRKHENVTAVLEGPMIWPHYDRAAYEKMWSVFMTKVDVDRLLYASTSPNQHPYWIINDFVDYQPPKGAAFKITDQDKAKILGLNLARYHNVDVRMQVIKTQNDRFSQARRTKGYREPYVVQRTSTV